MNCTEKEGEVWACCNPVQFSAISQQSCKISAHILKISADLSYQLKFWPICSYNLASSVLMSFKKKTLQIIASNKKLPNSCGLSTKIVLIRTPKQQLFFNNSGVV